ncbi:MAG: TadE/TadG family type IV pilus assembly protein [Pirellulaceae bacterium]
MRNRITKLVNRRQSRRGAAVTELAVCLPVIVLLVFGSLEGANMLFLKQAVVQSAYETAKAAAKRSGSQALGQRLGQNVLASRNIVPTAIQFSANVDALAPGTPFTVTVSAAGDQKSITSIGPFNGLNINAQVTMVKE